MNISRKLKNIVTFTTILTFVISSTAFALPEGATVQAGNATITTPNGATLNVNQMSEQAIIEWIRFCIAHGETVNFIQPGSESIALNRVTGGSISEIFGMLNANGKVWLINPNGIIFGPSSRINTGGFLASTLDISNENFLNKVYVFTKSPNSNGYIINKGQIAVKDGGYVTLLGETVKNEGLIQAKLGKVVLASGEKMTLELDGDGIISVVVDEPISEITKDAGGNDVKDAVLNTGTITAEGGTIILTASVLKNIFENAVNNEGIIRANSLVSNKGEVYLLAAGEGARASNTGTIDVSADESGADGGFVEISGDRVVIGGDINVSSEYGENGTLLLDPFDFSFTDANESFYETWIGNLIIQAENDVNFLLSDNDLYLQNLVTETFRVEAGNNINLNDDTIRTNGGNVGLYADYDYAPTAYNENDGTGDVVLGIGAGIITKGGNVTLSGKNVNIMAPTDINGFVVDTDGGNFNVMGTFVLGIPDDTQTKYTYGWEYFEHLSDRDYRFIELGFYYYNTARGKYEYIPFVIGPNIGRDSGTSMTLGNGIIYGDIGDLELYTKFRGYKNELLMYHQDPALNNGLLNHAIITPIYTGPGNYRYVWEDIIDLGDQDYNDAVMDFVYDRIIPPPPPPPTPPTSTVIPQATLWWDLRFKIPKKHLTDLLQVTYTKGPIELLAEQIYFYHPLVDMSMYEMPALGTEFYEFIDGRIGNKNPALLPVVLEEEEE
ncbi:MAG: hypothetical protein AMJ78_08605 [Omnitrophica WOR_2 bacterium SM23_29]|nr:MAG: hypothetical protein AMJ78_08605 [Omnitrophica WOR_2 bacterium SM23_29]